MSWDITSPSLISTIPEVSDSLGEDLGALSGIKVVSLDGLVRSNIRNDNLPSSADCFFIGRNVTFVEFKKWCHPPMIRDDDPQRDVKRRIDALKVRELERSIQVKAADSISIYNGFMGCPDAGFRRTRFILVDDSPVSRVDSKIRMHGIDRNIGFLRMFQCRDRDGNPVFYDEVLRLSPDSFIKLMEKEEIVFPPQSGS